MGRQDEKLYLIIRENPGPRQTKFTVPAIHCARKVGISGGFGKIARIQGVNRLHKRLANRFTKAKSVLISHVFHPTKTPKPPLTGSQVGAHTHSGQSGSLSPEIRCSELRRRILRRTKPILSVDSKQTRAKKNEGSDPIGIPPQSAPLAIKLHSPNKHWIGNGLRPLPRSFSTTPIFASLTLQPCHYPWYLSNR
jgi:hypothetical protein